MPDLISKKTRYEFQETFSGYYTLRTIETEFDSADLVPDLDHEPTISGARRSLVAQYYHAIDFSKWTHVRRLLAVFEAVLQHLSDLASNDDEHAAKQLRILTRCLERDGFLYENSRIVPRTGDTLPHAEEALAPFDLPELQRQVERMRNAVDDDPALAIGTAKELIETTCKTILTDRDITFSTSADLPELLKLTRKTLQLLPDDIPDGAKGAEAIRRLLASLGTIGQGLGEVRNLYGTGHGKHGRSSKIPTRIARLAVNSAATLAVFLFETNRDRP